MSLLALVAAVHAGFQVTVTLLVYPALVEVDASGWRDAHRRHSRRIVPVVGVLYPAILLAGVLTVASGPSLLEWCALALLGATVAVTATLAAPTHSRLGAGDTSALRSRLVTVDRVRCVLAVAGAVAAVSSTGF